MSTRIDMAECILNNPGGPIEAVLALLAERGMVVLGPDGEPLDVGPLLKGLGYAALDHADQRYDHHLDSLAHRGEALKWLTNCGITGPLADACLAAAEVEP